MEDPRLPNRVWAALERFDTMRDVETHFVDPVIPAELGTIHAFSARETASREPEFFDSAGPWAICGMHVKVRMPVSFTVDEEDACSRCAELVSRASRGTRSRAATRTTVPMSYCRRSKAWTKR